MKRPGNPDPVTRWLDAEREERADDAEAALLELFESLPPLAPSAGFADRVMQRIAVPAPIPVPVAARPSPLAGLFRMRWFRLVVASCLLATGISLFWLPQALAALAGMVSVGDLVTLGVGSMTTLGHWLSVAGRIGEWFLVIGEALAVALTSPTVIKLTVACLAISGISFVVLRDLMTRDRSWRYVDSIR